MVYAVAAAVVVMVVVAAIVAMIASRDDPIGLGRTNVRSFTTGLGTIFGSRSPGSRS